MAKMFATEAAQRVIDAAVQIMGGLGRASRGNIVEVAVSRRAGAADL